MGSGCSGNNVKSGQVGPGEAKCLCTEKEALDILLTERWHLE